jgi:hypothetical protein
MSSARKNIVAFTQIDPCLKWIDGGLTKLLNDGKKPYVEIGIEVLRSPEQSSKAHAMISDIVKQAVFKSPALTVKMSDYDYDAAKALLVRWFEREMESLGEPLKHGSRIVKDPFTGEQITIRASTTKFLKKETVSFVDWLYATGNDGGVVWSETALACYAEYKEAQQ